MILSAPSLQESMRELCYFQKNTQASLLLGPQLQNCQPFPYKTGIQQHVHSHTLRGGCYGFVMKSWGTLLENLFFFFSVNDHKEDSCHQSKFRLLTVTNHSFLGLSPFWIVLHFLPSCWDNFPQCSLWTSSSGNN